MRPHPLAPVLALDIDGTTGDYHAHLCRFAEMWTGRKIPWPPGSMVEPFDFKDVLGMSRASYRQMKVAYRAGGMKRSMPVFPGASELTREVRKLGVQVWICTTRPYQKFDNIDPDTRHWLLRNRLQWDGILYGPNKYRDLVKIVGKDRVLAVADDLPEQITKAKKLGLQAIMRTGLHNQWWVRDPANWDMLVREHGHIEFVSDCYGILGRTRELMYTRGKK